MATNHFHQCEVRESPGKGLGMFACKFIPAGTRVLQEAPFLAIRGSSPLEIYTEYINRSQTYPEHAELYCTLTHAGHLAASYEPTATGSEHASTRAVKTRLDIIADLILKENWKARFPHLNNASIAGAARIVAIFSNNSFDIQMGSTDGHPKAVFYSAARLNHSCIPNCCASWNEHFQMLCVHAIRDIQAEEELFITYDKTGLMFANRETRMRNLQNWYGFTCQCAACEGLVPSDRSNIAIRDEIANEMSGIREKLPDDAGTTKIKARIRALKKVTKFAESEGLETGLKAQLHMDLAFLYGQRGKFNRALFLNWKAREIAQTCFGDGHEQTQEAIDAHDHVRQMLQNASVVHGTPDSQELLA